MTVGDLSQARQVVGNDARYVDLTQTQYAAGLDLLASIGAIDSSGSLAGTLSGSSPEERRATLAELIVVWVSPNWFVAADELIPAPEDLPVDAAALAVHLGVGSDQIWLSITSAFAKVDLEHRARIGLAGERALLKYLEACEGVIVDHVSLRNDAAGYDVRVVIGAAEWHLEIKTTTALAQLKVHLSRNEYEVGQRDPAWLLVAVAIDEKDNLLGIGTIDTRELAKMVPLDRSADGRWEQARLRMHTERVAPGLPFIDEHNCRASMVGDRKPVWLRD